MSEESFSVEDRLLRAARRILRPLVRILLRNGISVQVAQEMVRKTYVDVAYDEFKPDGRDQTLANVSVVTGLNRKEVARLRKLADVGDEDKKNWTRAGKVLDGWLTDPEFQSEAGFPLDLPFSGERPNFSELVRRYSGDMYPRPLRDELLRVGALIEVRGRLRMSKRGYVPATDEGSKIDIFGVDTAELIETIDHNLSDDGSSPLLQYKVLADNLPEQHLDAFNEYSKRISLNAIDDIRRWLVEHDGGSEVRNDTPSYFAGVGVFQINRQRNLHNTGSEEQRKAKNSGDHTSSTGKQND